MANATSSRTSGTFSMSADTTTSAIEVWDRNWGSFQLSWTGIAAFSARAILQGSNDGTSWNDLGGDLGGIILEDTPDVQIWELRELTTRYLRLDYTANDVTTGTATWYWEAKR